MAGQDPYRWGRESLPNRVEFDSGQPAVLEDTAGNEVDPATEQTLGSIDGKVATETTLSAVDSKLGGTLTVEPDVTTATATDSGTGGPNAAAVTLGPDRTLLDVHVDTSGSATLTVEVSTDGGGTWLTFHTQDYASATTEVEQFRCAFDDVRAHLDQNRNGVTISAKGE